MKRRLLEVTEDMPIVRDLPCRPDDGRNSNAFQTEGPDEGESQGHSFPHIEIDANTAATRHHSQYGQQRTESDTSPPTLHRQVMLQNSRVASLPAGLADVQGLSDFIERIVARRMEQAHNERCSTGLASSLSTAQGGAACALPSDTIHTDEESWRLEWNSKCKDCLPGIRDLFSVEIIEMEIVRPLMRFLGSPIASAGHDASVSDVCEIVVKEFEGARFSKKNGTSKSIWASNLGQKGQEFRLEIAKSVLAFANNNASSILYPNSDDVDHNSIPTWIREGLVRDNDLQEVQNRKTRTGWSIGRCLSSKSPKQVI